MRLASNQHQRVRINRTWKRFHAAMLREEVCTPEQLDVHTAAPSRANCMRYWLRQGLPRSFRFDSALEACDLGVEPTGLRRPLPAVARPGSRDKVETLRRRYERGLHLHDEADCR